MRTTAQLAGFGIFAFFTVILAGCTPVQNESGYDASSDSLRFAGEAHLRNIQQLTFGGNNAEAYWSPDGTELVFQSEWSDLTARGCDQIFLMNADGSNRPSGARYDRVSTDTGRTTCSYFLPDGRIVFGSTHGASDECPIAPMFGRGRYVWPVFGEYDIYVADADGQNVEVLIGGPGYDAEATVSPDGKYIIFTSTRSGDLELWRYEIGTGALLQLTDTLGYDGGAFFSPDSQQIVWRADRPEGERSEVYQQLLSDNLVEPSELSIYVADIDGSNVRQVTHLAGANWAPFFHPDGKRLVFATNHHSIDQGGRMFDIFLIGVDGTGLTQITKSGTFDAFPMFSPDGSKIVFASNRNGSRTESSDTNVFVADWVEEPTDADKMFGAN
jgi:TolB protein